MTPLHYIDNFVISYLRPLMLWYSKGEEDTPIYRTPWFICYCQLSCVHFLHSSTFLEFSPSLSYHTNIFPLENSTLHHRDMPLPRPTRCNRGYFCGGGSSGHQYITVIMLPDRSHLIKYVEMGTRPHNNVMIPSSSRRQQ